MATTSSSLSIGELKIIEIQIATFLSIYNRKIGSGHRLANDSCNVSTARREVASNGAGEAAYLIRNKYSCHIPGAGWCQVFDCYPTPHVRERPGEPGISTPCFKEV